MKTIAKILLVTSIICCSKNGYSQTLPEVNHALSPNAAGLGLYGDIPVSPYTGTPNISIPLYDVKVNDYTLPISLNYHASGIQVDQRPGWVGLGWSLFAGGVITRTINDQPDDFKVSDAAQSQHKIAEGFYYTYGDLNTNNWNSQGYIQTLATMKDPYFYIVRDYAPDEFSFNFAGYSGKFCLDHNRQWQVQCNKPISVELVEYYAPSFVGGLDGNFLEIPENFPKTGTMFSAPSHYSRLFAGFTITTEDGTQYIFGGLTDAIEFSMNFFRQGTSHWTATAWYLTKIILPSKCEINFTYKREGKYAGMFNNQLYICVNNKIVYKPSGNNWDFGCYGYHVTNIEHSYEGNLIAPVYLQEITTDDTIISFEKYLSEELEYPEAIYSVKADACYKKKSPYPSDYSWPFLPILGMTSSSSYYSSYLVNGLKWYKLNKIVIKNTSQTEIKAITFNYSNSHNQRLILGGITESGKKPYVFEYYNINQLPDYLANKSDHWGFYNGKYASVDQSNYPNYYNDREPSAEYTKYGVLTKINYPTGGYTRFDFEAHDYRKQINITRDGFEPLLSSNKIAGGVRIKQIWNSDDGITEQKTKEYFYCKESDYLQNIINVSSGVLGGKFQYGFDYYVGNLKLNVFSSVSVLPSCHNAQGCAIGYTEVIEKNPDNSFTSYMFTNFDRISANNNSLGHMDSPAEASIQAGGTPYEPYSSRAAYRGHLVSQKDYNSAKQLVKKKNIGYVALPTTNTLDPHAYVRAVRVGIVYPCAGYAYLEGAAYKIYTSSLLPQWEEESFYDPPSSSPSTGISKVTDYEYNSDKTLNLIRTYSDNGGGVLEKQFKYPTDSWNTPVYNDVYYNMKNEHILPVVETALYHDNVLLETEVYNYALHHDSFYAPSQLKQSTLANTPEVRAEYQYDKKGNIREIVKDGADKAVYLWGYNSRYLIAKIENAGFSQITPIISEATLDAIANKDEPESSDWTSINNLRTNSNLKDAQVTTYTHKPLVGVEKIIDPRGVTTTYEYDTVGRLKTIKDENNNIIEAYYYHYAD